MKRTLIITGILLAIVIIGLCAYLFSLPATDMPQDTGDVTFPGAGSSGTVVPAPGKETLTLATNDDGSLVVNDFMHNGTTIPDATNEGRYLLAGASDFCDVDPTCVPGAPTKEFSITYFTDEQSFVIALNQEPLGNSRLLAERFLMEALGIPQASMCRLNYLLTTDQYVNAQFAGANLGFSFCPGATKLP
ncbi:MAG TPA: hypothetical protein VHO23_02890 [Candidatus Paceibacterota bacterium]|nr:hypothetical protein [Candidatus Paceibacterota bacterium]